MIIEAVSNAQTVLQEIGEANIQKFDEEFIRKVDIQLKETRYAKVISESSTIKSIAVNNYFLQQKKNLAWYSKDEDSVPENLNPALTKKILIWPRKNIKCQDVARCCRSNAETIKT